MGWLAARDENCLRRVGIGEYWEKGIEPEKWFDPAFEDFIEKEIIK